MNVFIVDGSAIYKKFFQSFGHKVVDSIEEASLVQFTGGEDVSSCLYGHPQHASTYSNIVRDDREAILFKRALNKDIPMAGICRGAQFLNVMNGGRMYQDVEGHTKSHYIIDVETNDTILVSSTHHQMMKPSLKAEIVAFANEGGKRVIWDETNNWWDEEKSEYDYEVIFYPDSRCLCFQPHPEFSVFAPEEFDEMANYYFDLIEDKLFK